MVERFKLGAYDCMVRPIHPREFEARVARFEPSDSFSHNLEDEALQIERLGDGQQNGMVLALGSAFQDA
jgi:PleD family two-component response regulator